MKKMIVMAALLLCTAGWADAQSAAGGGSSRNKASVSATSASKPLHTAKQRVTVRDKKGHKKTVTRTVPLRERKEYQWKDGQSATPTGHEATGINESGAVSAPRKDSAPTPRLKPKRG